MHCYPLLATEQSLIFDTLHAENPSLYLCQIQIYFTGSLDIVILLNAWRHALQSYEILRSCFIEDNTGLMQQIVHDQVTHSFQLVDFTDFPAKEGREKAYQQLLQQDIEIPFDLKIFPLMRLILCRMSSKTHRLIWTYHPILLDLGSTLRVFNETMQYYAAYYHQRPIPSQIHTTKREILSRLPIVDTRKIEDYWTQYLGNYTGDNTLPFSILKNKYIGKKTKVHAQNFYIEKSHYFNIKAFARKHGLTPSLILHAAWGLTLCTYLNTDDMLFGSVRTLSPSIIKNGAGLFINTLPIRVQFNEKTRVLDCLNSLRSQHRHLKQYWNTALNDIKRWLKLSPNQTLFNTCVSFSTRESNYILQKNFTDAFLQLNIKFNTDTHYPLMLEFLEQG
ncbi:MAG: hypothetical protein K0Q74_743, partial [Gammaproteobacteria bacterium]|nr:hypothetical protein [Gammaproteobacteria bacterium]